MRSVVEILGEVCELEGPEPFPVVFLELLRDLVGAQEATFAWQDHCRRITIDGASTEAGDPEIEAAYWDVAHSCPAFTHPDRTGRYETTRFSDLISRREYHRLPIYQEYFHPYGVEAVVAAAFPPAGGGNRLLLFFRARGERDFSDRDRDVLEQLRPHLARMHDFALLRARIDRSNGADVSDLTAREQEILVLVAEGKTNAEIARLLWVAPSTVKKHLENVYAKLEVPSRAAAVARARA